MVKQESGKPLMLPTTHTVDISQLQTTLGARAKLEDKEACRDLFPDCKSGAEPPFGNLFRCETLVDAALTQSQEIVFNAGSHWQTVQMRSTAFARLVPSHTAPLAPRQYNERGRLQYDGEY